MSTDLERINFAASDYLEASVALADLSRDIEAGHDAVNEQYESDLGSALSTLLKAKTKLEIRIQGSPELFEKPKTIVFDGVKFGLKKGPGVMNMPSDKVLLKRLKANHKDVFDNLPRDPKVPGKSFFKNWSVKALRALGIGISGAKDVVTIALVQSETEERIETLLKAMSKDKKG